MPFNVKTGHEDKNIPAEWATFEEAVKVVDNYDGIGFRFNNNGIVGVDIDTCINLETGEITDEALHIINKLDSYTEYSPSGYGVHIYIKSDIEKLPFNKKSMQPNGIIRPDIDLKTGLPKKDKDGNIIYKKPELEMYNNGRYFTVTGKPFGGIKPIAEHQNELQSIINLYNTKSTNNTESSFKTSGEGYKDDREYLKNGLDKDDTLINLWNGSRPNGNESADDLALFGKLAYWCNGNAGLIEQAFFESPYYSQKDDEHKKKCDRRDYIPRTIKRVLDELRATAQNDNEQYNYSHAKKDFNSGSADNKSNSGENKKENTESETTIEWDDPIPFTTIDTPEFPIESLPGHVAAFVEALAESTQTPTEMSAALSLGVLSTAFQKRYIIEITPDWKEPLCLYPVAVAVPGERKSAVIAALTAPLYDYEIQEREHEAGEIEWSRTEKDILLKTLETVKNTAAKAKNTAERDKAKNEAMQISEQLAALKDKYPTRLLVDDSTPEKLIDIMDMQGGCITIASAEGGVFDAIGGRYEKAINIDVYLKGHAGDPIIVDRMGRKSNNIKNPRLTMMLTIQPEVLNGIMGNMTLRGRGLCGRFLYAICNSKVGQRNVNPDPIQKNIKIAYEQFVQRILSNNDEGIIKLSPEANNARIEYAQHIEQRLGEELEHMRDWAGKLVGAMLRIAALIHAAECQYKPSETPVSEETVIAAMKIAECLCSHAMAAYQIMGADDTYTDEKYLLKRIESAGRDEISKRDLFDMCKGKFKNVESMEPALQTLIDMGYVREIEISTGERGRPSKKIILNPLSKNSKNKKY